MEICEQSHNLNQDNGYWLRRACPNLLPPTLLVYILWTAQYLLKARHKSSITSHPTPRPPQKSVFPPIFMTTTFWKNFQSPPFTSSTCLRSFLHVHVITSTIPKKTFSSTFLQYRQEPSLLVSIMSHSLTNHTIVCRMLSTAISTWGSPSNQQFHSSWWCQLCQKVRIS